MDPFGPGPLRRIVLQTTEGEEWNRTIGEKAAGKMNQQQQQEVEPENKRRRIETSQQPRPVTRRSLQLSQQENDEVEHDQPLRKVSSVALLLNGGGGGGGHVMTTRSRAKKMAEPLGLDSEEATPSTFHGMSGSFLEQWTGAFARAIKRGKGKDDRPFSQKPHLLDLEKHRVGSRKSAKKVAAADPIAAPSSVPTLSRKVSASGVVKTTMKFSFGQKPPASGENTTSDPRLEENDQKQLALSYNQRRHKHKIMLTDLQKLVVHKAKESRLHLLQGGVGAPPPTSQVVGQNNLAKEEEDDVPVRQEGSLTEKMKEDLDSTLLLRLAPSSTTVSTSAPSSADLLTQYKQALLEDANNRVANSSFAEEEGGDDDEQSGEEAKIMRETQAIIKLLNVVEKESLKLGSSIEKQAVEHQLRLRNQKREEEKKRANKALAEKEEAKKAELEAKRKQEELEKQNMYMPTLSKQETEILAELAFGGGEEEDNSSEEDEGQNTKEEINNDENTAGDEAVEESEEEEEIEEGDEFDEYAPFEQEEKDPLLVGFRGKLLPFQREGVAWIRSQLYQRGLSGILADDMGLGKTVQTIAFLLTLANNADIPSAESSSSGQRGTNDSASSTTSNKRTINGPHLITVPLSTMPNWVTEFKKFAPRRFRVWAMDSLQDEWSLKEFLGSTGSGRLTKKQRELEEENIARYGHPYGFDVVLAPHSSLARRDLSYNHNKLINGTVDWCYLVVDEAQRIKSKESILWKKLASAGSQYRLALSGTPLQNDVIELWSLLGFLMPDHFAQRGGGKKGSSHEELVSVFETLRQKQTKNLLAVQETAAPSATTGRNEEDGAEEERDGADDQDVEDEIDEKEIVMCLQLHRLIQPLFLRRAKADVLNNLPKKQDHVVLCPLTSVQKSYLQDPSICKKEIDSRKILVHPYLMLEEFRIDDGVAAASGKAMVLDAMLRFLIKNNHKTLVFCTWTKPLDVVETLCQVRRWNFVRLDGGVNVEDRRDLIKKFNTKSCKDLPIFFLSKGAGGVGLNLQSADTVIMLDVDYNPQKDAQALSRVYRVGQNKEVRVFRLLTNTPTELRMFSIAESKWRLEQKIIQAGQYDWKASDTDREENLKKAQTAISTGSAESLLALEKQKEVLQQQQQQSSSPTLASPTVTTTTTTTSGGGTINDDLKAVKQQLLDILPRSDDEKESLKNEIDSLFTTAMPAAALKHI